MFSSNSPRLFDRELLTIVSLSFCSMLIISTENTLQNMQKTIVESISDDKPGFDVDGYTVTGVRYTISCIALWFTPYVSYAIGPRITMALSALGFLFHLVSFITEDELAIYIGALALGVAEASFWPAEGRYMIENSSPGNVSRNAAVFLFVIKSTYVLGNFFVFFSFYGEQYLDRSSRNVALYSLSALNIIGVFAYGFLPKSATRDRGTFGVVKTIKTSWNMFLSTKMLLLSLSFSYYGLQMTFWNGVYSPSLGFTLAFGHSVKEMVGLSGIFMSFGGVIGCLLPVIFSEWVKHCRQSRFLFILSGSVAQLIGYLISFLIMPDDAVFDNTLEEGIIPPSTALAMIGSMLLSFGDACIFIQTYSILGDLYRDNSAEAIALHKFVRNAFAAASYYWSAYFDLYTQVLICSVMAVVHTISFYLADQDIPPLEASTGQDLYIDEKVKKSYEKYNLDRHFSASAKERKEKSLKETFLETIRSSSFSKIETTINMEKVLTPCKKSTSNNAPSLSKEKHKNTLVKTPSNSDQSDLGGKHNASTVLEEGTIEALSKPSTNSSSYIEHLDDVYKTAQQPTLNDKEETAQEEVLSENFESALNATNKLHSKFSVTKVIENPQQLNENITKAEHCRISEKSNKLNKAKVNFTRQKAVLESDSVAFENVKSNLNSPDGTVYTTESLFSVNNISTEVKNENCGEKVATEEESLPDCNLGLVGTQDKESNNALKLNVNSAKPSSEKESCINVEESNILTRPTTHPITSEICTKVNDDELQNYPYSVNEKCPIKEVAKEILCNKSSSCDYIPENKQIIGDVSDACYQVDDNGELSIEREFSNHTLIEQSGTGDLMKEESSKGEDNTSKNCDYLRSASKSEVSEVVDSEKPSTSGRKPDKTSPTTVEKITTNPYYTNKKRSGKKGSKSSKKF